jgi:hypothetical protein
MKTRRANMLTAAALAAVLTALFQACSPKQQEGALLEKQGRRLQAAQAYAAYASAAPADAGAPAALHRAAVLYVRKLGLCAEARPLLEKVARDYPAYKLPPEDYRLIYICPDYFPLSAARSWTYGDTQTYGRNARQEVRLSPRDGGAGEAHYTLYAGRQLVSRTSRGYRYAGRSLVERQGGHETVVLKYPLEKGVKWTTRGPEGRLEFLVEAADIPVKVKAGAFKGCVKVRRRAAGQESWLAEYYAPWAGKLLTAVAGPGYENRVMELTAYDQLK